MGLARSKSLAERNRDGVLLLARILLAAIFVQSGFGKLMGFEGFAAAVAAKGLPLPLLWAIAAVAAELGGSLHSLRSGDATHRPGESSAIPSGRRVRSTTRRSTSTS